MAYETFGPPKRSATRTKNRMEIYFKVDTEAWYDSEGGQRINFTIPAGTKLTVPPSLIYGEPSNCVDLEVL